MKKSTIVCLVLLVTLFSQGIALAFGEKLNDDYVLSLRKEAEKCDLLLNLMTTNTTIQKLTWGSACHPLWLC